MKEIIYKCNLCEEREENINGLLISLSYNGPNNDLIELDGSEKNRADIHICTVCINAVKNLKFDLG